MACFLIKNVLKCCLYFWKLFRSDVIFAHLSSGGKNLVKLYVISNNVQTFSNQAIYLYECCNNLTLNMYRRLVFFVLFFEVILLLILTCIHTNSLIGKKDIFTYINGQKMKRSCNNF